MLISLVGSSLVSCFSLNIAGCRLGFGIHQGRIIVKMLDLNEHSRDVSFEGAV